MQTEELKEAIEGPATEQQADSTESKGKAAVDALAPAASRILPSF